MERLEAARIFARGTFSARSPVARDRGGVFAPRGDPGQALLLQGPQHPARPSVLAAVRPGS